MTAPLLRAPDGREWFAPRRAAQYGPPSVCRACADHPFFGGCRRTAVSRAVLRFLGS